MSWWLIGAQVVATACAVLIPRTQPIWVAGALLVAVFLYGLGFGQLAATRAEERRLRQALDDLDEACNAALEEGRTHDAGVLAARWMGVAAVLMRRDPSDLDVFTPAEAMAAAGREP